jgi:hypothetical protein
MPNSGTVTGGAAVGGIRAGMADIITRVRALAYAGTADFTVGTVTYFADAHILEYLDETRVDLVRAPLAYTYELDDAGALVYMQARIPSLDGEPGRVFVNLENEAGTTRAAPFYIEDQAGSILGTGAYTLDAKLGIVDFASDQYGTQYYVYARTYNDYAAAAQVWRRKAAAVAEGFDFKIQQHWVAGSQKLKQCLQMAEFCDQMSGQGSRTITISREDML